MITRNINRCLQVSASSRICSRQLSSSLHSAIIKSPSRVLFYPAAARHIKPSALAPVHTTLISRHITSSKSARMSDEDYTAFLNKANKDYSGGSGNVSSKANTSSGISSTAHKAIRALGERYYTSDSDEPFHDVTFEWNGDGLPSGGQFDELAGSEGAEKLSTSEWDRQNSYEDVLSAVEKAAASGDSAVYKVEEQGARVTYYVLALDKANAQLVGVKVLAIES